MVIDASMEPMLEVFIFETTTLLEQLDEIMLNSEKSKSFQTDSINEIFRIMHTIKGSSAMMELNGISTLAHAIEDIFFIIREQPDKQLSDSETIFDLVFQALDFFKEEMESVQRSGEESRDPAELIVQLHRQAAILKGEAAPEESTSAPAAQSGSAAEFSAESGGEVHKVRVFFEDGCQMENIRAFMLLSQMQELCAELTSVPANPESDASTCEEIVKNGLLVIFTIAPAVTLEEIYSTIETAVNIKAYEPLEDDPEAAADETETVMSEPDVADETDAPESPAAQSSPQAAQTQAAQRPGSKQSLISVNQNKLDQLMDLVGELVTTESMVVASPDLAGIGQLDNFNKATRELRKLTDELQEVVMSIRMVPLSGVFQKMNRIVRDMCKKLGKQAELVTLGGDTEVDKTINEVIADPFMHMVRNAVDHAIEDPETRRKLGKPEVGRVTMEAKNIGGEIVITIADDGKGLDPQKLLIKAKNNGILTKPETEYTDKEIYELIMLPGFSTNQQVTEFSGRGVGMDVVRKNIEKVGGTISINSKLGQGTTFTIKIPLTLAIVEGMELALGNTIYTLPITSIKQSFKISEETPVILNTDGAEMIMLRGECYPLIRLHSIFNAETEVTDLQDGIVIQIESGRNVACIFADELLGQQQVVVKPFPTFLNKYAIKQMGLSGCTILGDGSISLILDANNLLNSMH